MSSFASLVRLMTYLHVDVSAIPARRRKRHERPRPRSGAKGSSPPGRPGGPHRESQQPRPPVAAPLLWGVRNDDVFAAAVADSCSSPRYAVFVLPPGAGVSIIDSTPFAPAKPPVPPVTEW